MASRFTSSFWLRGGLIALSLVLLTGLGIWLATRWPFLAAGQTPEPPKNDSANNDRFVRTDTDTLAGTPEAVRRVGIKTAKAVKPDKPMALPPYQGNLALDLSTLSRPRALFGGKVMSLGEKEHPNETPSRRPIDIGDTVEKGDLLAIIWSKDLGEKKSEFVDAFSRLRTDEKTLAQLKHLYEKDGGTSERSVRDAEQTVKSDKVALEKAERTLRSWELSDEQIVALRAEAETLLRPDAKDPRKDFSEWAKVEIRAVRSGTIMEKNINPGDLVDSTLDLFKIGDLSWLEVWVHIFEEDLQLLKDLPRPTPWTVTVVSKQKLSNPPDPNQKPKPNGVMQGIRPVLDPIQRTALVTGKVENPKGELKIGQLVTATIEMPVEKDIVIVPTEAVVEDGRNSVVLVQSGDEKEPRFVRKQVEVVRRFHDVIHLRINKDGVQPDDRVVTSGALLLCDALESMPVPSK
jgi:cobalt-zinc-cadmium efflux system membrane fusion protein